ncbi:MAG TPA: IPT/TIG domain-containing protein [Pyrinomonadaceae bacterium]|jgi:hypothetical protein
MQHRTLKKRLATFLTIITLVVLAHPASAAAGADPPQSNAVRPIVVKPKQLQLGKTRKIYISTEPASDLSSIDGVQEAPEAGLIIVNRTLSTDKTQLILEVEVDEDAELGPTHLTLTKAGQPFGTVLLELIPYKPRPIQQQATPAGITQGKEVDYLLTPLPYKVTKDNFGSRAADNFYAVEIALGNNSGFDMQIVNVGFDLSSGIQIAASDHRLVRGTVEKEQLYGKRALAMNLLGGSGMMLSGFLPFFKAIGPRANFSTFSSIVNGQFKDAFGLAAPDLTIRQLNRLENQTMHDEIILPNNQQMRTIVFVPRGALNLSKEQRDNLPLIRQMLGNLILVGRPIEIHQNRQIVVRAGASGGFNNPNPSPGGGFRGTGGGGGSNNAQPSAPPASPSITDFSPKSGLTSEQKQVTITGSNFKGGTTVTFGGTPAVIQELTADKLVVIAPTHLAGDADIVVQNPDGQKVAASSKYTYFTELLLSGIDRTTGVLSGGEKVRIFGNGFAPGAKVVWGGTELPASAVKISPEGTSIEVTTPARDTATNVTIVVTNPSPNGQSKELPGGFTYVQPQ